MKIIGLLAFAFAIAASAAANAATTVKVDLSDDAIAISPATVSPGPVTFDVTNASIDESHEMVVLKIDAPDTEVPVDAQSDRINEDAFKSMGEISKLTEGDGGQLEATLEPGSYMLICNYKGHFRHGMHTVLTVK
jgi:uncharacterized cupredoxin-like copper-binding protein